MKSRKFRIAGVVVVLLVVIAVAAIIVLRDVPETSTVVEQSCLRVEESETCLRFPIISGANLPGDELTFPDDFTSEYVLAIVPFSREQETRAETWLPLAQQLMETYPDLSYYNIPIFTDLPAAVRFVARTGLSAIIADDHIEAITVTVFLEDRDAFLEALEIPDVEIIQVFLMNTAGEILWRTSGEFSPEKGDELAAQMAVLAAASAE
jgi:hypothetical protein